MPLSRSRDYLSIGEVLEAIRPEFPDISISKLRFLEAEGLITPERTDSGYRKFYRDDLDRLRFILSLQRDHFLPLKVIRERLAETDANGGAATVPAPELSATPEPATEPVATDVQLSRAELATAAGLSDQEVASLEDFGILAPRDGGTYEGDDLLVAKAAKAFLDRGLEARHLKMYKQFAEREAAMFEQMVGPVTRRRDPEARQEASASVSELATFSRQMREALLRASLRGLL